MPWTEEASRPRTGGWRSLDQRSTVEKCKIGFFQQHFLLSKQVHMTFISDGRYVREGMKRSDIDLNNNYLTKELERPFSDDKKLY